MTAPMTEMRHIIIDALNTEFAPEGIVFASDKLHPSLGTNGPVGGVYPDEETAVPNRRIQQLNVCFVQLFCEWHKEVNPAQSFDPDLIEGYADRLRKALKSVQTPATAQNWYFTVASVGYMDDPTGNRSRFLARVEGAGSNSNLVETGP